MKSATKVEKGGDYICLYHLKNKIRVRIGDTLPRCNFAGLNCEGNWHLKKEIKKKTAEEIQAANNHRRQLQDKRRNFNRDFNREMKIEKPSKWRDDHW